MDNEIQLMELPDNNKPIDSQITVVQLSNYTRPDVVEDKQQDWVMNGQKNIFYQYVIDRYNGSTTNGTVINAYIDLIYGRGLTSENKNEVDILSQITDDKEIRKIVADFELFGEATVQIMPLKGSKNLPKILHVANQKVIPAVADKDGVINHYWYSNDWEKFSMPENKPEKFNAFDGSKKSLQIYKIKPYRAGKDYFSDPDYLAGLPYAEMEEEIANYCINHIQNGLAFGYIINVPGGANWDADKRKIFEDNIKKRLTGTSNAGKFVIAFNGIDVKVEIVPLNINDAHKQWEFLTSEARQQILTAHRVTSPMLFGIKDNTGLGNNAEELDTAEMQLYKRVIAPKQKHITDCFKNILLAFGIDAEYYFLPLSETSADVSKSFTGVQISSALEIVQNVNTGLLTIEQGKSILRSMLSYPNEELESLFSDVSNSDREVVEDKVPDQTELSSSCCSDVSLSKKKIDEVIDSFAEDFILSGEDEEELEKDFELVQEDEEAFGLAESDLNDSLKLATAPKSSPQRKSEQDTSLFKIRYKYAGAKNGQREFCKKVVKANRVYRWEDLQEASKKVVNAGFGLSGADTYDIAKYKGGVNCKHFWQRKIYLRRNNKAVKSVNEARRMILDLEPEDRKNAKWVQNEREVAEVASAGNNYWRVKK